MPIDAFIPRYDFLERHEIVVSAAKEVVRKAVEEWRPEDSLIWRLLLRLRGLGAPQGTLREWGEANGFLHLAEGEDEVVYGQIGRFWAFDERAALRSPRTLDEFLGFDDPDYAMAVMNVRAAPLDARRTLLSTETRVRCLGPSARSRFRLYWLLIRPFSGLLRRSMLRGMAARAVGNKHAPWDERRTVT